jgi:hypothetical protein
MTTIKEVPGHKQVATGNNIQTQVVGGQTQYLVPAINPYPNPNLVVGNTYSLTDPTHQSLVVALLSAPGGGMQTATFVIQK